MKTMLLLHAMCSAVPKVCFALSQKCNAGARPECTAKPWVHCNALSALQTAPADALGGPYVRIQTPTMKVDGTMRFKVGI